MKSSQRKEMALCAVHRHGVSVVLACRAFSISETCYRYACILSEENEEIADWLVKLTGTKKAWVFWIVFFASTRRAWFWLEPQACIPDLLRVGTELADQITQTLATGEAKTSIHTGGS